MFDSVTLEQGKIHGSLCDRLINQSTCYGLSDRHAHYCSVAGHSKHIF